MKTRFVLLSCLMCFILFAGCKKNNIGPERGRWTFEGITYKADTTYGYEAQDGFSGEWRYEFAGKEENMGVYIDFDKRPAKKMSLKIGDDVKLHFIVGGYHFYYATSGNVTASVRNDRLKVSFSNVIINVDGKEYKSSGVLVEQ